ncbi:MAG: hypothetical protein ACM3ML_14200 [Micromonosporaceae bacterium]
MLAVLVTQFDAFRHLLGTTDLGWREFTWARSYSAVALLVLWEAG